MTVPELFGHPPNMRSIQHYAVLGLIVAGIVCDGARAETPAGYRPLSYPYDIGSLSFPRDEGKHSNAKWPFTLIEWYAHYAHLAADDGSRYFLFTTFVAYDPLDHLLDGKFPHMIAALVDVNKGRTYHYGDVKRLKTFATGHADVQTAEGDYFKWKGDDKPFQYDFHVAWRDPAIDFSLQTDLVAVKPPLAVGGSGYIKLPKGDSGYYSQTRLKTTGRLTINGVTKRVSGIQWIDRQWLGMSFVGNMGYSYDWWALQLDNREEAILFRIWDTAANTVVMSVLEINHADGKREHVDRFVLSDTSSGWCVSAATPGWDLQITPACKDQGTWRSCDITGTIRGQRVHGLAAAELARNLFQEPWLRNVSRALSPKPGQP